MHHFPAYITTSTPLRYCFGGGAALGVATRSDLVNAVVTCHAFPVNIGYISRSTVPLAMMCADGKPNHQCYWLRPFICDIDDTYLPPAKRDRVEVVLRDNSRIPSKLAIFPGECLHSCRYLSVRSLGVTLTTSPSKGTRHGFATRPNLGIPQVRAGFEGAFEDTCSWFKMHLH